MAGMLLLFAWKGSTLDLSWPLDALQHSVAPEPTAEMKAWAADAKALTPKMLPTDRVYLSNLYDAMAFVLLRDLNRGDKAIIKTTDGFEAFHAGTLKLAIDKAKVGAYPGLDKAIDKVFFEALGSQEPRVLSDGDKRKLIAGCGALSYTFAVGRDE